MASKSRVRNGSSDAGLPVKEDFAFAKKEWKIQRIGWLLLGLIALAAVLGLFGGGVWSSASLADHGLHLQYERFERLQRPTRIQLRLSGRSGEAITIFLDRAYLNAIRIERIIPQPEKVQASARGLFYQFSVKDDPISVTFHFEIEQAGRVAGQIGLVDGPMLSFNQFVYP